MRINKRNSCRFVGAAIAGVALLVASMAVAAADTVRFSVPPWPGAQVKAELASQIVEALGYDTEINAVAPTLAIKAVSNGDVDVLLDVWIPSQQSTLEAVQDDGHIDVVNTNLDDALYGIVVPDYVWEAGVHSIADLAEHADQFGSVVYGIDAGSDGNLIVKDAVKDNTYDLQGWRVSPSTTAGMLAQEDKKIRNDEWIAFLGWRPHWMNIEYDLKYLDDPEGIWGSDYLIYTIANKDFLADDPNMKRFFEQFEMDAEAQGSWILEYGLNEVDIDEVAKDW